ncbi:hypothetical protein, partial [Sphingobacterium sp. 1.A.4]|uniref:hypothetical protein n=1 Tax=Sphingobacterium sp. 1.A.4 TaxID=2044603 RepID=UPI001C557682
PLSVPIGQKCQNNPLNNQYLLPSLYTIFVDYSSSYHNLSIVKTGSWPNELSKFMIGIREGD